MTVQHVCSLENLFFGKFHYVVNCKHVKLLTNTCIARIRLHLENLFIGSRFCSVEEKEIKKKIIFFNKTKYKNINLTSFYYYLFYPFLFSARSL